MTDIDDRGYSEETCLRCGWTMGQPPLNCQNNDTPHIFPSSEAAKMMRLAAYLESWGVSVSPPR